MTTPGYNLMKRLLAEAEREREAILDRPEERCSWAIRVHVDTAAFGPGHEGTARLYPDGALQLNTERGTVVYINTDNITSATYEVVPV